jgi:Phosphoinositide phospholipase C, Ca2+-dependent
MTTRTFVTMRRSTPPLMTMLALVAVTAAIAAACAVHTSEVAPYPRDRELHINQLQALGTQNSYHLRPPGEAVAPEWDYAHAPLDRQLDEGVRQLELDVHYAPDGRFHVFNLPRRDENTTCALLRDCLSAVREWSVRHPLHQPVVVLIQPEDDFDALKIDGHYDALDAELRAVVPRDRIITPDDVRAGRRTLTEAVRAGGWPTLSTSRGRMLFVLADEGSHRAAYSRGGTSLDGRVMFVYGEDGGPLDAIRNVPDPVKGEAEIRRLVGEGDLVRTQADEDGLEARIGDTTRVQAALRSGAQLISTNYPTPADLTDYLVAIPAGEPSRCNPASAPRGCTALDIENPRFLAP